MEATRLLVALALLAAIAAVAILRRGRKRDGFEPAVPVVDPADVGGLKAPLTAIVFKSRFCLDCQDTPRIVAEAAPEVPVVAVDVGKRPDLAKKFKLVETPTLFLVDQRGRIRYARVGNPAPEEFWTYAREAWDSLEVEGEIERRVPAPGAA